MLADDRFKLPFTWRGAAFPTTSPFGTALSRTHPESTFLLRQVERKKRTAFGVWEERTGKLIQFLPNIADASWTPDGKRLVTVDEAISLIVLDWPALSTFRAAPLEFDTRAGVGGVELGSPARDTLALSGSTQDKARGGCALLATRRRDAGYAPLRCR